jgi:protein-L-isoaspartate O-methyltransferase
MARRAKPSGKPTTRVRETLTRLGYAEHEDFEYEVEVRLYGNRRLYADVMLFQGDTPLVVVEVEGHARQQREGYEEARLKGAAWNLENPVPLLWVAAGNQDALYQLQPSQSSIQYAPLDGETPAELLAPARLLEAIGDYLRRTETEAGQELRYRDALQRALAESRGNSAHEKFRNWIDALAGASPRKRLPTPLREAQQIVRQARQSGQPNFALALALRHTARGYFRPLSKNDAVRRTGRYYTPTEVIQLMVESLAPDPKSRVLDFACGSGGFLLATAHYWVKQFGQDGVSPASLANQLHGVEYDAHAYSLARMVLEVGLGVSVSRLHCANALNQNWQGQTYDCILCNPPAGKIEVDMQPGAFQYAGRGKGRVNEYEVAFAELAVRLAASGGRIGLIVPEGLLSNSELKPFRKWLFGQARPVAILGLPRGLFPHTPSRMYALMMVKSPRRKPKRCLITELRRHEISGNRAAVVRLVQGVLHA